MIQFRSHQSRALDVLQESQKGCVYVPTGGGKTIIMMEDYARRLIDADKAMTVVVVAPRLLLANQLCSEFVEYVEPKLELAFKNNFNILHVHSGDTVYDSSTRPPVYQQLGYKVSPIFRSIRLSLPHIIRSRVLLTVASISMFCIVTKRTMLPISNTLSVLLHLCQQIMRSSLLPLPSILASLCSWHEQ